MKITNKRRKEIEKEQQATEVAENPNLPEVGFHVDLEEALPAIPKNVLLTTLVIFVLILTLFVI